MGSQARARSSRGAAVAIAIAVAALVVVWTWGAVLEPRSVREGSLSTRADEPATPAAQEVETAVAASPPDPTRLGSAPRTAQVSDPAPHRVEARATHALVPVLVRVLDRDGLSPMPGMRVELWSGRALLPARDPRVRSAVTDGEGTASFEVLRPEGTALRVAAHVTQRGWGSPVVRLELPPAEGAEAEPVELVLRPVQSTLIRGEVYDGETVLARSGTVRVFTEAGYGSEDHQIERFPLSKDGTFELRLPIEKAFLLRADLPHGPWAELGLRSNPRHPVVHVELHAFERGEVSGRLVDLAGRALVGYPVQVQQAAAGSGAPPVFRATFTREDGGFHAEVEPKRLARVAASAPGMRQQGHWLLAEGLVPENPGNETYTLPLVRLTLNARDDSGRALRLELDASVSRGGSGRVPQSFGSALVLPQSLGSTLSVTRPSQAGWIRAVDYELDGVSARPGENIAGMQWIGGQAEQIPLPAAHVGGGNRFEFLVEAGHTYRFELRGPGHAVHREEVWVPVSELDLEVELTPRALGDPAPVEFTLLTESGEALPGTQHWYVRTTGTRTRVPLWSPRSSDDEVIGELLPGAYTIEVELQDESEDAKRTLVLEREIWVEPVLPQRFEFAAEQAQVLEPPR